MRRINPGTVTVVVMAILFGLVATYVVRQSMNKKDLPVAVAPPPEEDPGQRVVIATANIPKHTQIARNMVQVTYIPADRKLPEGYIKYSPAAINRYVTQPVRAGQAITEAMLMPIGAGLPEKADAIPEGHRAVTLQVQAGNVGSLIDTGSHVDVTLSVEGDHPELGGLRTQTLLQAIKVVDIEDRANNPRLTNKENISVTVAATPADANKLITAERMGDLSLTLVSPNDTNPVNTGENTVNWNSLLALSPPAPVVAPPVVTPPQPKYIEQWKGTNRSYFELPPHTINERDRTHEINVIPPQVLKTQQQKGARKVPKAESHFITH